MNRAEATFVRMYDEHYDEVHAFCVRRVGRDDADDAASEVFAAAWRRIADVDPATARGWLFGVARRVVLNQWRSASRRRRLRDRIKGLGSRPAAPPETIVVRRAQDAAVVDTLSQLREADQEILRLAAWEELTGPEIAVALGISLPAVQQRLHRAKQRLAQRLAPQPESFEQAPDEEAGA